MLHENFTTKVSQESPEFVALMKLLSSLNEHANEGRTFLCLVDHIIDFYLQREDSADEVKMPIVYFPLCEEWAQNLCEEFVTLKMSLFWGTGTKNYMKRSFRPYLNLPQDADKRTAAAIRKQYRFQKAVNELQGANLPGYPAKANEKCFIFSRTLSDEYTTSIKSKGHYHFCVDILEKSLSSEKSLILLEDSEEEVYNLIEKNDGKIKTPNFFMFIQKDMDGRNIPMCMQMQRTTIKEYNEDYDTNVRNVFFFAFSQKPYRLQRIYELKCNWVERLQREKIAEARDFISFTQEEMDYIFGRQAANIGEFVLQCDADSEQLQLKDAFDLILQDLPHEVKLRNELAICCTEQSLQKIKEDIVEQNPEANDDYIDYFLQIIKSHYQGELGIALLDWVNLRQIAVVVDYNVDSYYKNKLEAYLKSECGAVSVRFYSFKNLRAHKTGNAFRNDIKESRILVMSMLNHCTGKSWAIYPNSFDQYYLNPGQSVLQINNRIVFDPRYSWYLYRYQEQLKLLLNSDYRVKHVKNGIALPPKPTNVGPDPKDDEDEQNIRNRVSEREQVRVSVAFAPRQHRTFDEDELMLCKYDEEFAIYSLADIMRIFEDPSILKIQPLSDFHQPLEVFIDNAERKTGDGEMIMRNNPKYGLSDTEKLSKREMWKILLEHQVELLGETEVYNRIMSPLLPVERIQLNSFRRWLDPSEPSILPRSRRMQRRVIEEFLGVENLYTRMLRHRKSRMSTNTEGRNTIFRAFLTRCLLENNFQDAYKGLSHEVRDYLNVTNGHEVKIIIDLIMDETLNLRPVKSIQYDQR